MIWIILIVLVIAIMFFRDKSKEVAKINMQGGMKVKYSRLIEYFLDYPNARILDSSSSSITIVVRDPFVVTHFRIAHGFNDFTIFWTHESTTFGKHELYWTFPEYMNHENVINNIENELGEYSKKIMSKSL